MLKTPSQQCAGWVPENPETGEPEHRCKNRVKAAGGITKNGDTLCRRHGGNIPEVARQGIEKHYRRINAVKALRKLAMIERVEATSDPFQGILEEVDRSSRLVLVFEEMVAEARTDEPDFRYLLQMFSEERDRHVKFSKVALDANVAERQIRLQEATGAALISLVMGVLMDRTLDLSADQVATSRRLLAERVREAMEAPTIIEAPLITKPGENASTTSSRRGAAKKKMKAIDAEAALRDLI